LKDTNSNFLAVNKAFAKAAGLENPSDLIGKNDLDFFPKDLAEAYRKDDQYVMASLEKKELEEEIAEDGKRKWFQTYKAPIFDEYGNVFATVGFARDITKDKESAERLKLLASVFTSTHEGIAITDTNNQIVDVNEAFSEITGYSRMDVLGKNPNILQSGRNDESFYTALWASLQKEGVWKGELWNRKKNREEYVENTTISAVYDNNNVVQNYVAIFTDITQQKQYEQELEHRAYYDGLTNLPNRMLFADRLQQASAQVMRREQLLAVVYVDIDGFKQVNDTYGHDIGDKLLVVLADNMRNLLRDSDTISRVGGDEFLMLLVDITDKVSIDSFLSRLLKLVSQPIYIDTLLINVSASIGVSFYPQDDEIESKQLIKQADIAMYQAKISGKNKYVIFSGESDTQEL
jgi:diguanylate cyclase (GGDEF)-like protein/PAS domain S-box-containing protein